MQPFEPLSYKCHITLDPVYARVARARAPQFGFRISTIAGDEVLGDKVWLYCIKSDKSCQALYIDMISLCVVLEESDAPWVRRKIEAIIIDDRRSLQ